MSGFALVPRVLGLDYGRARIGVAISDELGMLAHPLATISATNLREATKRIAEIARENKVERVVLGMPRQMDGGLGLAAADVNAFAEKLRAALPCEVVLWDERLTTAAANRALHDAGRRTKQTRGIIDQVAAQMILQSYLDRCRTG
jgi:putative Holliday junction resolvase